jgi:hypothetical protein
MIIKFSVKEKDGIISNLNQNLFNDKDFDSEVNKNVYKSLGEAETVSFC